MGKAITLAIAAAILALCVGRADAAAAAEKPMVRIAELEIDPAQLDAYKALLAEEQEASVRLEPGVIMLHSVAIADEPTRIHLLEVYASRAAYEAHIKAPHFVHYKLSTEKMVRSLRLIETEPILLCAKSKGLAGGPVACF
ncbi:antibiotic biosynthesis monooxygenase [Sphingomonas deserti]|uniref:Antibiotic biosynthesis monooxygenase n=2 Tax=Allosphingosinicella deserti TaxID=2116704 RepID=A0A2P7QSP0_9SPHN|nr:antibiotic biosynthesis monooxygenase [Sphingomonas deserti]